MAKSRQKKESEVQSIVRGLKDSKVVVFTKMAAIKVADSSDFRRRAKKEKVNIMSAKKTLLRLALKEAGVTTVDEGSLKDGVTLLFGQGDEVSAAKLIQEFGKDRDNVAVYGGLFGSTWMTAAQVKALATLPSKEQLIAQVVGTIKAPLTGFANVLQGNLRNLVYVLNAVKESKTA